MRDWKSKTPPVQCLSAQHLDLTTVEPIIITINPLIVVEEETTITEVEEGVSHLITSHNILLIKNLVQEQRGLLAKFVVRLDT